MNKQSGFTLIELIVVIVILGILAATALPRFIDVKSDAELAAANGVAGAVNSAFVINEAGYLVNTSKGARISGTVTLTAAAASVMGGAGMPTGYTLTAAAATVNCGTTVGLGVPVTVSNSTLSNTAAQAVAATLICTG